MGVVGEDEDAEGIRAVMKQILNYDYGHACLWGVKARFIEQRWCQENR